MSIVESLDNMWKFQNRACTDRRAALTGQPSAYGQFPPESPSKKRKKTKGDSAPQSSKALGLTDKKKKIAKSTEKDQADKNLSESDLQTKYGGKFLGPRWGIPAFATNTCPLNSLLVAYYAPYAGKALFSGYP